jgi:hypothetical protein
MDTCSCVCLDENSRRLDTIWHSPANLAFASASIERDEAARRRSHTIRKRARLCQTVMLSTDVSTLLEYVHNDPLMSASYCCATDCMHQLASKFVVLTRLPYVKLHFGQLSSIAPHRTRLNLSRNLLLGSTATMIVYLRLHQHFVTLHFLWRSMCHQL